MPFTRYYSAQLDWVRDGPSKNELRLSEILAEIPDIGSNVGLAGRADVCVSDLNSEQAEIELVDGTDFRSIDAEYTRVRVSSLA